MLWEPNPIKVSYKTRQLYKIEIVTIKLIDKVTHNNNFSSIEINLEAESIKDLAVSFLTP